MCTSLPAQFPQSRRVRPRSRSRLSKTIPTRLIPVTTIRFGLGMTVNVNLTVYDILGRRVAVLVNERLGAGDHQVRFDGTRLASGVYFYRMQAGSFVQTRKLLLLR